MSQRKVLNLLAVLALLLTMISPVAGKASPLYQVDSPEAKALALLEQLTPEEKVGQLFLVTYQGTDISEESQIYDLVVNRHVGGVMLMAENGNFFLAEESEQDLINQTWSMLRELQTVELLGSQVVDTDPISGEPFMPTFIPLFIGISQEGDGYPKDQILEGLTPLPNNMAIGATWNPELATQAGVVLGRELKALGFNFLSGPSLDVIDSANIGSLGDPGTSSYGGDPYWVSKMGLNFVNGLKLGSESGLLVIAKHLPGIGGADRPVEEEVPTIRKSLTELIQFELAPFFAVTVDQQNGASVIDGMLLTHIQYQGFTGNIYSITRPASFDKNVVDALLALDQFSGWRQDGGLIVSDKLGAESIRKYDDPTENTFNARIVARDALLAGNDLLFLYSFQDNDDPDSYTSIIRTLDFFSQKYREDPVFAARIDESVLRILTKKFSLYDDFILDNVLTPKEGLDVIGNDTQVAFSIAQESVTLLSPSIESLGLSHPGSTEQIVFITDSYSIKQCPDCSPVENIGVNDLSYAVDELYGLEGAGLISRRNLFSYSFADLNEALNEETGGNQLQSQLRSSTWVIFCMSQPDESRPESLALQRLLSERADWLQGKNVIVFAFNAPYYLDITDISKLTAYYALYSKQDAFVEVAARVLFSELPPAGASPVSVPGITYNLSTILSADPEQTISLRVWKLDPDQEEELIPAEFSTELTGLEVGDHIKVQTSVILDHNGNPVPDNTPVLLVIQTQENEEVNQEYIQSETRNGIVEFDLVIQTGGPTYLQTQMLSGDTELDSSVVILDVFPQEQVMTPTPTNTPEPPQIQPSLTPDMLLTMTPGVGIIQQDEYTTTIAEWLVGLLVSLAAGVTVFQIGALTNRLRWRVRWALITVLGGLLVGTYFAFVLPGSETFISLTGITGVILLTLIGTLLGSLIGWMWGQINDLL